ncbi:hypothetical protein CJ739_3431 [Mariniflexile rhizosphaerae]|nr:hypothetical protein CJ739_3431 [Mariniflexile sp. TRM1-10]
MPNKIFEGEFHLTIKNQIHITDEMSHNDSLDTKQDV